MKQAIRMMTNNGSLSSKLFKINGSHFCPKRRYPITAGINTNMYDAKNEIPHETFRRCKDGAITLTIGMIIPERE